MIFAYDKLNFVKMIVKVYSGLVWCCFAKVAISDCLDLDCLSFINKTKKVFTKHLLFCYNNLIFIDCCQ